MNTSQATASVERWEDAPPYIMWKTVVRFFVGGPLDGRAIEGADSREWEAGPMAATTDYWHKWFLYTFDAPYTKTEDGWLVYTLHAGETLQRANRKYVADEIDLDEFEQAVDWALAAERLDLYGPDEGKL